MEWWAGRFAETAAQGAGEASVGKRAGGAKSWA